MVSRRLVVGGLIFSVLLALIGGVIFLQERQRTCLWVPILGENLLPNADMRLGDGPLPEGWQAAAPGVQRSDFAIDGDGRAMQLMGVANHLQTPPITVVPGQAYCFHARAITDSVLDSPTRLQVAFQWLSETGDLIAEQRSAWQPVVLWRADDPPDDWSYIDVAFIAPPRATTLHIRLHPASDDRIMIDAVHVRQTTPRHPSLASNVNLPPTESSPVVWPHGYRGAVSFSFDWETAMGGLVHSRSVGDSYTDLDPELRGLRMRDGITTTIELFRPYGIRATYFATGYNFLHGNPTRIKFMGDPTYTWANRENRWTSDQWVTTPWFAPDPDGTIESHPAWYFGDLIPPLQAHRHDIQSHTFSHFYGGFVPASEWQRDVLLWNELAAQQGVPPARVLAFPWSSSGGMSDASWDVLEQMGIMTVTRLSTQSQYSLFARNEHGIVLEPHCRPFPGQQHLLACPDFYLTPTSVDAALAQIDRVRETGGVIDIWAHTEEVISPEQQAAWARVVQYAAEQGDLWIAPLDEIAAWQRAYIHYNSE